MSKKLNISKEQIDEILPYVSSAAEMAEEGRLGDLLYELDAAIVSEIYSTSNYESTDTSRKLQKIYDAIYSQN